LLFQTRDFICLLRNNPALLSNYGAAFLKLSVAAVLRHDACFVAARFQARNESRLRLANAKSLLQLVDLGRKEFFSLFDKTVRVGQLKL